MNLHDPAEEIVALRAEVAQLRLLANNVPVAIAYYESSGFTCRFANLGYASMFGRDEQSILGLTFAQVIGTEATRQIQPMVHTVLREHSSASYERRLPAADGGTRWIEVNLLPHLDARGVAVGAFVLIADITRHRRAELALRESEVRLAKFMQASAEGIVFHRGGIVTDVNPPFLELTGRTLAEMLGQPALDFVAPDQRERVGAVMAAGSEITYETAVEHRDGTRLPVEFIVRTMQYQGERLRMTIVRDLRDRIADQARIHHLAHHDALTGLPNRGAFIERVEGLLPYARARDATLALLFIDLDHFKRVNDSLGHLAGDALLRTVAHRITSALRAGDLVARFGGDEFVVLLSGDQPAAAVREVAQKLLAVIGAPVEVEGASISVTPSIGISMFPQDGQTPDALIKHADTAMYHAKSRGRADCRFFEPVMAEAAYADLAMESRLAQAIRDREFVLHYQPQVSLHDGALVGCEALIRWVHPERGLVGPDAFIPLAESRRLMLPIGDWVLREAVVQARRWRAAGLAPVSIAVNLSTTQFQATGFVDAVQRLLAEQGVDGRWLEIELTERMLMDDLASVRDSLERLRALGVRVAVDDFGTGYTSLGHLKNLPIDRLKIDRSFIRDLPGDGGSAAIAGAVIQMAHGLGMRTVAEGVETPEQRDWVAAHGCDELQGNVEAEPMPAAAFEDWLRARQSRQT
jgi:diguanylate cyclase (GGDEF)-like protein/PAS domain S-box-containing protein